MKKVKNISNYCSNSVIQLFIFALGIVSTNCTFAEGGTMPNGDIIKTALQGSIGQTLGSGGMLWGLLTAIGFAVTIFHATTTNNPKAAIPGFILSALVSTVTTYFITF